MFFAIKRQAEKKELQMGMNNLRKIKNPVLKPRIFSFFLVFVAVFVIPP